MEISVIHKVVPYLVRLYSQIRNLAQFALEEGTAVIFMRRYYIGDTMQKQQLVRVKHFPSPLLLFSFSSLPLCVMYDSCSCWTK